MLNAGRKVALLVGAGALGHSALVEQVADRLGAGAAKALLGKTVLDDRLPWVTGAIGLLGTTASWHLMRHCDTLLIIGSNMPYSEYYPEPGQARGVQIDIDGAQCGLKYPTEVNLTGDAGATLAALLPLLDQHDDDWRTEVAQHKRRWDDYSAERAAAKADPVNPEAVVRGISARLPRGRGRSPSTAGRRPAGTPVTSTSVPAHLGSLSGPAAVDGRRDAVRDRGQDGEPGPPVLAMIGDGAMQMNGVNELITVSRYWERWANRSFVVLVLNNRDLSFVAWETRGTLGAPPDPESSSLPDVPYADWARLLGLDGARLEHPDQIDSVLDAAFAADRPFVIDAVVDANVPLIPPHLTANQVLLTAKAEFSRRPGVLRHRRRGRARDRGDQGEGGAGRHGTADGLQTLPEPVEGPGRVGSDVEPTSSRPFDRLRAVRAQRSRRAAVEPCGTITSSAFGRPRTRPAWSR